MTMSQDKKSVVQSVKSWDTYDLGVFNALVNVEGGLPMGSNMLVYGSPAVGKTTTMLNTIINVKRDHPSHVILFIDADHHGVHPFRLKWLTEKLTGTKIQPRQGMTDMSSLEKYCKAMLQTKGVFFYRAEDQASLQKVFIEGMKKKPHLVIIDTITQYFRVAISSGGGYIINQTYISLVNRIIADSRKANATLLLTAQRKSVLSRIQTDQQKMKQDAEMLRDFVGGEILGHFMDYIIDLSRVSEDKYLAKVWKHRVNIAQKKITYRINNEGMIV